MIYKASLSEFAESGMVTCISQLQLIHIQEETPPPTALLRLTRELQAVEASLLGRIEKLEQRVSSQQQFIEELKKERQNNSDKEWEECLRYFIHMKTSNATLRWVQSR
jgi:dipeptidase